MSNDKQYFFIQYIKKILSLNDCNLFKLAVEGFLFRNNNLLYFD